MTAYLDNSATTAVCPQAAEKMLEVMTKSFGNPSSTHSMGREAKKLLDEARSSVSKAVDCAPEEIFFTSGGTEADNLAIFGAIEDLKHMGNHIITSSVEHDAVLKPMEALKARGFEITYLAPDERGSISAESFAEAIRPDTVFASIMTVNNETGAVNDIKALCAELKKHCPRAIFHTDAVQAFCKIDVSPRKTGVDLMSISSHKIHGSKGTGALFVKKGTKMSPVTKGGGQERDMRPGTEGLPGIVGFGVASELAKKAMPDSQRLFKALRETMIDRLENAIPEVAVIGGGADHILNVSFPGYRSEVLLNYLDSKGVYISKGSACKKGARSHVLTAMGLSPRVIDGAVRISFCRYNTLEEINYAADMLIEATEKLIKTK